MTAYNGRKYINEQIESILNQIDVDVSLYVSDDFSTDGTLEVLKTHSRSEKIRVLKSDKKHGTAGKNFYSMIERVSFSGFDFVAFSDQDDVWALSKLKESADFLKKNLGLVGVSSCVEAFWENGRSVFVDKSDPQQDFDFLFEPAGPGCTYLITANFANEIKQLLISRPSIYNNVFAHDWLIYAYARKMGYGWHIFPFSTLRYRQHADNETGVNSGIAAFKVRMMKLKSGWYFDQVYALAIALGYENDLNYYFKSRGAPNLIFWLHFRKMRRKFSDAIFLLLVVLLKIVR